jgi:excisionase family DNA binding protein
MASSDLLTLADAAAELNLTDARLRQLSIQGRFPARKYGTLWLVSRRDLDAFRKQERPPGRPPKTPA